MSTQEEKKMMNDEELNTAAEETATPESNDNVGNAEQQPEEPLTEVEQLKLQLAEAEAKIAELQDRYLRQAAEFDNYRKRTIKEKAELILNGGEKAITAILPILDDMERAIASGEKTEDPQVLKDGMSLIYTKFIKTLEGLGVNKIAALDEDFDTDIHEAIAMVPGMGDDKKGKVIDCVQTGYKLNEKVIRHAKVAVGQ